MRRDFTFRSVHYAIGNRVAPSPTSRPGLTSLIKDPAIYRRIGVHSCDPDGRLNRDSLEADLVFFAGQGLIQGKVDVASAIDTSIAEEAVRDLGPYARR